MRTHDVEKWLGQMKSPSEMKIIQIELTNACPKRCSNCTRLLAHARKPFFMELDFFKKAIDSLDGFEGMVGFMGGEPTLHPDFEEMVEYAVEKRQKHFKPSRQFREPIEDFGVHYADSLQKLNYPLGLWSMCGPTYYKHYELIQEHFQYQCLNDHLNEGLHQTLLTTRKELGIPDKEWIPMRDACWIQNTWSASITPKGAFFCEVAAALDMIYDGPGGWPVEPGWWKRKPSDFGSQLNWCEQCGAALKAPRRKGKEEIEDMSPHHYEKLLQIGSPAIRRGKFQVMDVEKYKPENYVPDPDWYIPDDEKLSRYKQSNPSLKPKRIDVLILSEGSPKRLEEIAAQVDSVTVVAPEKTLEELINEPSKVKWISAPKENRLQKGLDSIKPKDWVFILNDSDHPIDFAKIKDKIWNPGCLYYTPNQFCMFNILARSLRGREELKEENFVKNWPEDKQIPVALH
ncbi:MAG: radical SAM protein [Parachlamydiales bacterium]|nr:radical SAM protein [Parachlamydiales bacterium]